MRLSWPVRWRSGQPEGPEAVSLWRLAQELGVTPMALYRHVRDKQDLINAMTEAVLEGIDPTVGFRPEMTWTERMRTAIDSYKEQIDARPLPCSSASPTQAMGPRHLEDARGFPAILLDAGFERREAIVQLRMISILLAAYLLALQQGAPVDAAMRLDAHQMDLMRRHFALAQLSLPRDEFPNLVESAEDTAEVWLTDPNHWWPNTVDLIMFGLERMLERSRAGSRPEERSS